MKKLPLIIITIAIIGMTSCQNDNYGVIKSGDKGKIGILVDEITTKSPEYLPEQELLFSVPVILDNGDTLGLTAFISDWASNGVLTKGAPATTANLGPVYGNFITNVFKEGDIYLDSFSQKQMSDVTVQYNGGPWSLVGGPYYWPDNGDDITFCSYSPKTISGLTDLNWNFGQSLSFKYSLPAPSNSDGVYYDAENQPDILFAMDTQNKNSRVEEGESYADIHFTHALTGVRFIRGDIEDCTIQNIKMIGFYDSGSAVAIIENGSISGYTWSTEGASIKDYTQSFNNFIDNTIPYQDNSAQITGGSLDPTSDQSYTFMMIPQLLADGAAIEITIKERIHPIRVELTEAGTDPKIQDWRTYAGKMITISLNSSFDGEHLDIEIEDTYEANVKYNPIITNTAEVGVDAYIRVAIVANWVKESGMIIYPYAVGDLSNDSHFTGFDASKWVYDGGFYYYKYRLPIGDSVKLFEKFTAPVPGDSDYPSTIPDIDHMVMSLVVQGIDFRKKDEMISTYGWPDVFSN